MGQRQAPRGRFARAAALSAALLCALSLRLPCAAVEGADVPYRFAVDSVNGRPASASGSCLTVMRDVSVRRGEDLRLTGWVAAEAGIRTYEYALAPSGGGAAVWRPVSDLAIAPRRDLSAAGVPFGSGHGSAGFSLRVPFPADRPDGYLDLSLRALDRRDRPLNLIVCPRLRFGEPDTFADGTRSVSLARLAREEGSLRDASVAGGVLTLRPDGRARLGDLNLSLYESLTVRYAAGGAGQAVPDGRRALLGLKRSGARGYGAAGGPYDATDSLTYAALPVLSGEGRVTLDLSSLDYRGEVWLAGYLSREPLSILSVTLTYRGMGFSRTAARILFSGSDEVTARLSGAHDVRAYGAEDPVLGDVLRIELTRATNDPYVHFSAGDLMRAYGVSLDASDYPYLVLVSRVRRQAPGTPPTTLYLCAGEVRGATEACTVHFEQIFDGRWHAYLLDLTGKTEWRGRLHGWRFDPFSGDAAEGDLMDVASAQFFHTREAALSAAAAALQRAPHRMGDPSVLPDDCERRETPGVPFTIPAESPAAAAEPPASAGAVPPPAAPGAAVVLPGSSGREGAPARGCASSQGAACPLVPLVLPLLLFPLRPREKRGARTESKPTE